MIDTLMDNLTEPSSSLSFTSTSHLSNGANSYNVSASSGPESGRSNLEIISLSRLSSNLEKLLLNSEYDCSDVEIVVEGIPVGVHRCILAARSQFFHELFAKGGDGSSKPERKPKYHMNDLVPDGRVGHEAFIIFLSYLYTGKLKPSPQDVSTCVDTSCVHDACRPAVNFAVELMYASSVFQIAELVSLFQIQRKAAVGQMFRETGFMPEATTIRCTDMRAFSNSTAKQDFTHDRHSGKHGRWKCPHEQLFAATEGTCRLELQRPTCGSTVCPQRMA